MDQSSISQVKKKPSDFVFGKLIGEGSFSTVSYVFEKFVLWYIAAENILILFLNWLVTSIIEHYCCYFVITIGC